MPVYLIKNNLKLMLRSKWLIAMMIAGPIIVIAVLSSAFEDLLKSYEGVNDFTVGYHMEKESLFNRFFDSVKEAGGEAGITFVEFPSKDVEEIMRENDIASFVDFSKEEYTIYKSDAYEMEGITTVYFLNQWMDHMTAATINGITSGKDFEIPVVKLDSMPEIEAKDYYAIVYLIYFIWCCFISLAPVFTAEKKHGIGKKFEVSPVSDFGLYMAKVIPCVLATICELSVTIVLSTVLFELEWKNIGLTVLILLLTVFASTVFGIFLHNLLNNLAMTIVAAFSIIWVAGFFGGSFETYMFSIWPENLKRISPIYHINRTLVEYSTMGSSNYTKSCIVYLIVISIICMAAGFALGKLRKGKKS